jgi:hypothetical protein
MERHIKSHPEYFTRQVDGHKFIFPNDKINIPNRKEILNYHHMILYHPGIFETEKLIKSHLTGPGMRIEIEKYIP